MKKFIFRLSTFLFPLLFVNNIIIAQETIPWLKEFTDSVMVGSYTYNYNYTNVEGNECKIRIEEKKTSKKGSVTTKAYIFYLNDLDLSALNFKTSGSNAIVNLEIKLSQKFIAVYTEGELKGYTNEFSVYLSEVDKARSFIEVFKTNSEQCMETDLSWSSNKETIEWLTQNIGESTASGTTYKQVFSQAKKDYLVQLVTESTDSKGTQKTITYDLNLSDIDPDKIDLVIPGEYFKIVIPTRENKNYIMIKQDEENYSYAKSMEIYSDEIELARNIFNAILFLANSTPIPERKNWDSYQAALGFVKENLDKVDVGTSSFAQSLSFDDSPSDMVHLSVEKTDAKGLSSVTTNSFYLSDLLPDIALNASTRNISIDLEIRDKNKFIRKTNEAGSLPYDNTIQIYEADIETARDLINALENAITKSEEGIIEFDNAEKSILWLNQNVGEVKIDATSYDQSLKVSAENENRLELSILTKTEEGGNVDEIFKIYPQDLSMDDLVIKVSGKKMAIPLSTGKLKYIQAYKNETLQNYTSTVEVLFDDVQKARNFISAIKILYDNSYVKNRLMKDKEYALTYLDEHIKDIEINGETIKQQIEKRDDDDCKMNFITKTTDSKGAEIETRYEFTITDIDPANSLISVSMNKLMVDLITKDKEKLIKPYKNGEEGNFVNSIELQFDDVLVAKNILGAFATLEKICE